MSPHEVEQSFVVARFRSLCTVAKIKFSATQRHQHRHTDTDVQIQREIVFILSPLFFLCTEPRFGCRLLNAFLDAIVWKRRTNGHTRGKNKKINHLTHVDDNRSWICALYARDMERCCELINAIADDWLDLPCIQDKLPYERMPGRQHSCPASPRHL